MNSLAYHQHHVYTWEPITSFIPSTACSRMYISSDWESRMCSLLLYLNFSLMLILSWKHIRKLYAEVHDVQLYYCWTLQFLKLSLASYMYIANCLSIKSTHNKLALKVFYRVSSDYICTVKCMIASQTTNYV